MSEYGKRSQPKFASEQSTDGKQVLAKLFLLVVAVAGFFIIINSLGSLDSDYIVIEFQVSLNVKQFFTGLVMIIMASTFYKLLK